MVCEVTTTTPYTDQPGRVVNPAPAHGLSRTGKKKSCVTFLLLCGPSWWCVHNNSDVQNNKWDDNTLSIVSVDFL